MPRAKKQILKKRPDGRYACRYKGQWFYSYDHDDCLLQREEFKKAERRGAVASYFVSEYAKKWVDRTYPDANTKTLKGVKRHVQILSDAIGDLPLSSVKPSDIKDVYSTAYKGLSNSYILAGKNVFAAIFDSAVADGIIMSNPVRNRTAKPHRGTVGGHRSITDQERQWILTYCTDHRAHPAAMAMLYAGLRPQEAKAFVIDRDVDFKRETVTVRQTAHTAPDNWQKYAFSDDGKTSKANRTIPLLPPLKTALEGRTGLLIESAHGQPVTRTVWAATWTSYKRQMERAINGIDRNWYGRTREHKAIIANGGKLPPWIEFTVTPYDLRHSFATMCRNLKPPVELHTVIKWMGHSDATMILKIYDSVTDERDESEAQRLRDSLTTDLTTKP
jgi:integrase